LEQRALQDSNL